MAKKRLRVLLLSCATVLVCLALIIAGTYALFSDSTKVTNHLEAGTLKVGLVRQSFDSTYLNKDGLLQKRTGGQLDFTNASEDNVFGLEKDALIAPKSVLSATLIVSNLGNVAFDYSIQLVHGTKVDADLASQIKITAKSGDKAFSKTLSEGSTTTLNGLGLVLAGKTATFTVTVEFMDDEQNNLAMTQEVNFDIIVHAIQNTTVA